MVSTMGSVENPAGRITKYGVGGEISATCRQAFLLQYLIVKKRKRSPGLLGLLIISLLHSKALHSWSTASYGAFKGLQMHIMVNLA